MKRLSLAFMSLVVILAMTSCVENSKKYQTLLSKTDSLQTVKDSLEENYNETIDILNQIELGFQQINKTEQSVMLDVKNADGQPVTKKQQIISKVGQIRETIASQQAKINELQKKLNQSGSKNSSLANTIKRMQAVLDEKTASIESLQNTLAAQNIKIDELSNTVTNLNENVAQLTKESENQQATIRTQDTDLNMVYFCVGTEKELIASSILEKGGLFKGKKLLKGEFDEGRFTKADMRNLQSVPLNTKKAKLLTTHPSGSYTIEKDSEGILTLTINDYHKFWSVSNYLVVKAK